MKYSAVILAHSGHGKNKKDKNRYLDLNKVFIFFNN